MGTLANMALPHWALVAAWPGVGPLTSASSQRALPFSHCLTTLFLLSSPSLLPALDVSLVLSVPHLPLSHCLFSKDCCFVDYVYNKDMNQ